VEHGGERTDRHLPFESHGDVDEDDGAEDCERPEHRAGDFAAPGSANGTRAYILSRDSGDITKCGSDVVQLIDVGVGDFGADAHLTVAELLNARIAKTERRERVADIVGGRGTSVELPGLTALELDTEVQAP